MFIEILFIKAKGTENNTTVHNKNGYIHCVIFTLEYYITVKINFGNIMLSNKAVYRKYIRNDSMYITFQNMLNDTIWFRNPNKCGKTIKGRKVTRIIQFC